MSILWADDFNSYGTSTAKMLDGLYAEVGANTGSATVPTLVADPELTATGTVIKLNSISDYGSAAFNNIGSTVRYSIQQGAQTTVGIAFRLWMDSLPGLAATYQYIQLNDNDNVAHLTIKIDPSGTLSVYRGYIYTDRVLLGTTASPVITAGSWTHVELKATINNSSGAVEIRINGDPKLTLSSVDTQNSALASVAQFRFCSTYNLYPFEPASGTPGGGMYIKDLIVWNTAGSINNNFFGPCIVAAKRVNGDVSFNWTASTGSTGYNLLDEASPDDTDYISATVAQTTQSEFAVENLPADVTSVRGMILLSRMWASDGGDCKVQMGVKSNGDQGLGTDRQITVAKKYWADVVEVSPDTGVQFTPVEFDAMTFTIDRTT